MNDANSAQAEVRDEALKSANGALEVAEQPVAPALTIGKGQDRIPFQGTLEDAVAKHGPGSVYVDGKCYKAILAEQEVTQDVVAAPPVAQNAQADADSQTASAAPAVNAAEGDGDRLE